MRLLKKADIPPWQCLMVVLSMLLSVFFILMALTFEYPTVCDKRFATYDAFMISGLVIIVITGVTYLICYYLLEKKIRDNDEEQQGEIRKLQIFSFVAFCCLGMIADTLTICALILSRPVLAQWFFWLILSIKVVMFVLKLKESISFVCNSDEMALAWQTWISRAISFFGWLVVLSIFIILIVFASTRNFYYYPYSLSSTNCRLYYSEDSTLSRTEVMINNGKDEAPSLLLTLNPSICRMYPKEPDSFFLRSIPENPEQPVCSFGCEIIDCSNFK